jgi:hypothetical protein
LSNHFADNGSYGNPTNGDFDQLNFEANPTDCYSGNSDSSGHLSPDSASLETKYPSCTGSAVAPNINVVFLNEVLCDSQVKVSGFGCLPTDHYPRRKHVMMHALPSHLATMPNPCAGVPANPWCRK